MNTAELNRQIENIIRTGVILEASAQLVRVKLSEDLSTDWLQYIVPAAGGVSVHRQPSVGESCVLLSPSGVLEAGIVLCGFASGKFPKPSMAENETVVQFPDGARIVYDHAASHLDIGGIASAKVTAAGNTEINCPQNTINGATIVNGLLTCTQGMAVSGGSGGATATFTGNINHIGELKNTGKMSSNGVTVDAHQHSGVIAGDSNTGDPVK